MHATGTLWKRRANLVIERTKKQQQQQPLHCMEKGRHWALGNVKQHSMPGVPNPQPWPTTGQPPSSEVGHASSGQMGTHAQLHLRKRWACKLTHKAPFAWAVGTHTCCLHGTIPFPAGLPSRKGWGSLLYATKAIMLGWWFFLPNMLPFKLTICIWGSLKSRSISWQSHMLCETTCFAECAGWERETEMQIPQKQWGADLLSFVSLSIAMKQRPQRARCMNSSKAWEEGKG